MVAAETTLQVVVEVPGKGVAGCFIEAMRLDCKMYNTIGYLGVVIEGSKIFVNEQTWKCFKSSKEQK